MPDDLISCTLKVSTKLLNLINISFPLAFETEAYSYPSHLVSYKLTTYFRLKLRCAKLKPGRELIHFRSNDESILQLIFGSY
ncbi:hypothetical protein MARINOS108_12126 [Marinoscillum sp. 108]|nr:hypothetical protein MARINOS108_12126 [Marinoscillum sp. 108]